MAIKAQPLNRIAHPPPEQPVQSLAPKGGRSLGSAISSAISPGIGDQLATRAIAILMIYAAAAGIARALTKPLWYDELYTLALARQVRVSTMWDALRHAADTFPPNFFSARARGRRTGSG